MSDPLDPAKFHILSKMQQKKLTILGILLLVVVIPVISYVYYKTAINRPAQTDREITFEIQDGEPLSQITKDLYDQELINSQILFRIFLKLNKIDSNIQAGTYVIPAGTPVSALATLLQHGTNDIKITFLEGWRAEEFARQAHNILPKIDYEDFVQLAKEHEGYLMPDTYFLYKNIDEQQLLKFLMDNANANYDKVITQNQLDKTGLTREQVIIFASIVEREVANSEDRPIVAGILINRWKNSELIGADATTQYVAAKTKVGCELESDSVCPSGDYINQMNWWPMDITQDDLNIDSPYNTRKNLGLPPTPISNPSINAVEAVLNYTTTNYNYYLTDKSGVTRYATTLDEHNRNVAKYILNQ